MVIQRTFLERYFWLVLCAIFFGLFLPLLVRDWLALKAEGLHDVEWHTTALAEQLHRDLGQQIPLELFLDSLNDSEQLNDFDQVVQQKIEHLGLVMVKIYDRRGTLVYSTNPDKREISPETNDEFQQALAGSAVAEMISTDEYAEKYHAKSELTMAEVYVPIGTVSDRYPSHVLEAYYDITPILDRMERLFYERAVSLALLLLVIIGILGVSLRNRQAMVRKVKMLEAALPICMHCKKIRLEQEEQTEWVAVEKYFHDKDEVDFSHGVCDDCMQEHYPEIDLSKRHH